MWMFSLSGRWDYPLVLSNVHADCNFTSCGTPLVLLQCIAVNLNQDLCHDLHFIPISFASLQYLLNQCTMCRLLGCLLSLFSKLMYGPIFVPPPFFGTTIHTTLFSTPMPPIYTALIEVWWCNGVFFMATSTWGLWLEKATWLLFG